MSLRVITSLREARQLESQLLTRVSELEREIASVREALLRLQGAISALEGLLGDRDPLSNMSSSMVSVGEPVGSPMHDMARWTWQCTTR